MEEKPSYFAIIPATVRYDSELKANEKLLYGEISSLCNKNGICWASNKYFANLYDVDISTISRWVNNLVDRNYLYVKYDKDNTRCLSIDNHTLLIKKSIPIDEKVNTPIDEKVKHNNININNKNNNSIYEYYENKIGLIYPNQYELFNDLIDKVGEDKIKEAIDIAVGSGNKVNLNYIISIANSSKKVFTNSKRNFTELAVPKWMTNEPQKEEMSEEELKELEEEMSIFK